MEPTGIEPVTSCLGYNLADNLVPGNIIFRVRHPLARHEEQCDRNDLGKRRFSYLLLPRSQVTSRDEPRAA